MFYETAKGHGLPHDPFKAIVAPRPIGWISTVDDKGRPNLAPYSFFSAMANRPPMVGFTSEGLKDSVINAKQTREFVCNLSTLELAKEMNETSAEVPLGVDEFKLSGLVAAPCRLVKPPRVAASPAVLECKTTQVLELANIEGELTDRYLVIGQVVGVHIDDAYLTSNGRFDTVAAAALARCGYRDYSVVTAMFEMERPSVPDLKVAAGG
jgi:flavin reductase (DIM6/NTAB) family NADH-FMN oxidoreductase RutF